MKLLMDVFGFMVLKLNRVAIHLRVNSFSFSCLRIRDINSISVHIPVGFLQNSIFILQKRDDIDLIAVDVIDILESF
jgi:hypothetical protein